MTNGFEVSGKSSDGYDILNNGMKIKGKYKIKTDKDGTTIIKGKHLSIFGTSGKEENFKIITNDSFIDLGGGGDKGVIIGRNNNIATNNDEEHKGIINSLNVIGSGNLVAGTDTELNLKGNNNEAQGKSIFSVGNRNYLEAPSIHSKGRRNSQINPNEAK